MGGFHKVLHFLLSSTNAGILMGGISAVFTLVRERWKSHLLRALPVFGVILGMLWAFAAARQDDADNQSRLEGAIQQINDWTTQQTQKITDQLRLSALGNGVAPTVVAKASNAKLNDLVHAANLADQAVLQKDPESRQNLTIRVFDHFTQQVNYRLFKPRLDAMAATVQVMQQQVNVDTNSVWWGPGSSLEDAKTVALIVSSAGIDIHQVCPAKQAHGNEKNLIQVGGSAAAQRKPTLSNQQIQSLTAPVCAD